MYSIAVPLQNVDEEVLLIEAAKADVRNFEPLYRRYYEAVFRFTYQRLDDRDQAYDITTNVFIKALGHIGRFEHRGIPFSSWLFRIARNELNQMYRSGKSRRTINLKDSDVINMIDEVDDPGVNEEYFEKMIRSLDDLDEDELAIIEMRFFEKRSFREVGEVLGMTENNAKVRCYRILGRMKNKILNM